MKVAELRSSMMLEPIPGFKALVHTKESRRRRRWQTRHNQIQLFKEEFIDLIMNMDPLIIIVQGPIMYVGKRKIRTGGARGNWRDVTVHELLTDGTVAILHGREFRNLRPIQSIVTNTI